MNLIETALLESMKMNQFIGSIHEDFSFIDILADTNPNKKGVEEDG